MKIKMLVAIGLALIAIGLKTLESEHDPAESPLPQAAAFLQDASGPQNASDVISP